MTTDSVEKLFSINGKVVVATGGGGVLVGEIARVLAAAGARVAVVDIDENAARSVADDITASGNDAIAVQTDVLDKSSLEAACAAVGEKRGEVEILINAAGGNKSQATTNPQHPFFYLPQDPVPSAFELHFLGTMLPCQVFGRIMAKTGEGVILNISSMNSIRPLTRIPAYSAAKAAVSNFTQWLAVHMAQEYSPRIRVNAIAPGFFLTQQNRFLLTDQKTSELTPRGHTIIEHTPMARIGEPADLLGAVHWLISPASTFVSGVVLPIDGGFSAFSGV